MNPGVFIDIDGVLLKGGKPFEWTKEAIHVIFTFTHSHSLSISRVYFLSSLFGTMRYHSALLPTERTAQKYWPKIFQIYSTCR